MIQLNKNFRVNSVPLNLVLEERRKRASGDEYWQVIGFYPDVLILKKALIARRIKDVVGNFTKLAEIQEELINMLKVKE